MRPITPLDFWRSGFEFWLVVWRAQIAFGEQMGAVVGAARSRLDADPPSAPAAAPGTVPEAAGDASGTGGAGAATRRASARPPRRKGAGTAAKPATGAGPAA